MVVFDVQPLTSNPYSKPIAKQAVSTLSNGYFVDPKIFDLELAGIFQRKWLFACHELRFLASPSVEMSLATLPVILTKDSSGPVRAFRPLPEGTREEIPVHIIHGFVFVCFSQNPGAFEESHMGLAEEFKAVAGYYDASEYEFLSSMEMPGKFNWKVFSDNYNECYHCPTSHPGFSKVYKISSYVVDARSEYLHHSVDARDQITGDITDVPPEMQLSEKTDTFPLSTKIAYDAAYSKLNATMREYAAAHPSAGAPAAYDGALFVYVFPNIGINIFGNFFSTLRWNPLGVGETRLETDIYVRKGVSEAEMIEFSNFIKWVDYEDFVLCEATQSNLALGIYKVGVLHPFRENGLVYHQGLVRKYVEEQVEREGAKA
ncbi:Bet v1-like protein [Gonapodya prolifera JEL478]|uniref:Choline monooxygenase, chloroplastic n=1 Tax=Gonapodya prolifera (strain JEL478) TaxID=1344416 RepID=A0A139AA28_GONPJ|nr:Bet v1-like protein [Gonapodya prolifera JEL478]|eukprot:KXS13661.1 Bet v1-like protein [Gonapodya prolifera JEL478]